MTLGRLTLIDGTVSADAATADYLLELIGGEARRHCSAASIPPIAVVRHLTGALLNHAPTVFIDAVAARLTTSSGRCSVQIHARR